jgi:pimeloyl-ACP methyl ester carboxylesterase
MRQKEFFEVFSVVTYFAKGRRMKINLDGVNLNYELSGAGPCLVLIHGFTDNLSMWFNQVPQLSKQFQVVTYDLRGHGQTETTGNEFSVDLLTKDLYELLKTLNIETVCILGYSHVDCCRQT